MREIRISHSSCCGTKVSLLNLIFYFSTKCHHLLEAFSAFLPHQHFDPSSAQPFSHCYKDTSVYLSPLPDPEVHGETLAGSVPSGWALAVRWLVLLLFLVIVTLMGVIISI